MRMWTAGRDWSGVDRERDAVVYCSNDWWVSGKEGDYLLVWIIRIRNSHSRSTVYTPPAVPHNCPHCLGLIVADFRRLVTEHDI